MQIRNAIADIWASLDPKFQLAEILAELLPPLDQLGFRPLSTENLKWNADLSLHEVSVAAPLPNALPIPQVQTKHDHEYLNVDFCFRDPDSRWVSSFADYDWPKNSVADASSDPQIKNNPALRIELVRGGGSYPSVSAHLLFSTGVFGLRHLDLQAMLAAIDADLKFGGASVRLSNLKASLARANPGVAQWESQHAIFFKALQLACETKLLPILKKFANTEKFLIQESKSTSLADLETLKDHWLMLDAENLELSFWIKRFRPNFEKERAMKYLSMRKQDDNYANRLVATCVQTGKHCWQEMIRILGHEPISPTSQLAIISFIADPNWPGADIAENIIHSNLELFRQSLVESVKIAMDGNDPDWANRVRRLLGEEVDED